MTTNEMLISYIKDIQEKLILICDLLQGGLAPPKPPMVEVEEEVEVVEVVEEEVEVVEVVEEEVEVVEEEVEVVEKVEEEVTGGLTGGLALRLSNDELIAVIKNDPILKQVTKNPYLKKLDIVMTKFFETPVTVEWIIYHPDEFQVTCLAYGQSQDLSPKSTAQYIAPLMFIINNHASFNTRSGANKGLRQQWLAVREIIEKPDEEISIEHQPTERQKNGYIPFNELCAIRDALPDGSYKKLLLSMYTMIEPLRSDFVATRIYWYPPDPVTVEASNYIVLGPHPIPRLFLNEYKTKGIYGQRVLDLPQQLVDQIQMSLDKNPERNLLFPSIRSGSPFTINAFNKWANRLLKDICHNEYINLTQLRHIYLSRDDLGITTKTNGERRQVALKMCHSIGQQLQYKLDYDGGLVLGEAQRLRSNSPRQPPVEEVKAIGM